MSKDLFNPEVANSLSNLELKAKHIVEGFITGIHKSPFHGYSVEFSEHRQYRPGDEIRHIDWQVFGRTNKFYVKQFEEETNLRCTIFIDSSKSMSYYSNNLPSKYNYAMYLASILMYLINSQRDAVGIATFNKNINNYMPPRSKSSYVAQIIKHLESTEPSNETNIFKSFIEVIEKIKKRGLIIIISDFFDNIKDIENVLNNLRHKNHEVILFQIFDPSEISFDFANNVNLIDMENNQEIKTNPTLLKKDYSNLVNDYINKVKSICYNKKIDYNMILTNEDFDKALLKFISKRK